MTKFEKFCYSKYKRKIASTRGRVDKLGNEIEMRLSFEEFVQLYNDAGVYPAMPYVVSRVDDIGHYEVGNVFISTISQNSVEAHGDDSEDSRAITNYCLYFKYRRNVVKKALKAGRLNMKDVYELIPIQLRAD